MMALRGTIQKYFQVRYTVYPESFFSLIIRYFWIFFNAEPIVKNQRCH